MDKDGTSSSGLSVGIASSCSGDVVSKPCNPEFLLISFLIDSVELGLESSSRARHCIKATNPADLACGMAHVNMVMHGIMLHSGRQD